MIFQTDKGVVELFGCGHAGVINLLTHVRATIDPSTGPRHHRRLASVRRQRCAPPMDGRAAQSVRRQGLVGAHCTGLEAVYRIRELAGDSSDGMVGAVGASYSLDKGINPLRVAK